MKGKAPASQKSRGQRAAEQAWIDSAVLTVSPGTHAAFLARLNESPKPNDRLRRTMQTIPPWE